MIVSTADWDHPLQTNKQHVARTLAGAGWSVLYVESLGLRSMSASVDGDGGRVLRRLARVLRGPRQVTLGVTVASPLVVPAWSRRSVERVNALLLAVQRMVWWARAGRPDLVIVYSPIGDLLLPSAASSIPAVYHCVDDVAAQPNMPVELIDRHEQALVRRVRGVVTTSAELARRARARGARHVLEQTNVVDAARFAEVASERDRRPARARPRIGFVGAVSSYKLELDWIVAAARTHPEWDFELHGPVGECDPDTDVGALLAMPNVRAHGVLAADRVPATMAGFDVAILPTPCNRYTRSMFPMKFFEYLAAGAPVVATRLDSLSHYNHVAMLVDDVDGFITAIERALRGDGPSPELRRAVVAEHTYERRTAAMLQAITTW
jgi:glycosyltransferase involved in cell wall biosynthesis